MWCQEILEGLGKVGCTEAGEWHPAFKGGRCGRRMAENGGGGAWEAALGLVVGVVKLLLIYHFGSIIAESALFVNPMLSAEVGLLR